MSRALGPGSSRLHDRTDLLSRTHPYAAPEPQRAAARHAADEGEARLLVVDPVVAEGGVDSPADALTTDLAWRGVHVTAVASTIDGLVEFGRGHPAAVIVAPDAPRHPPG